MTEEGKSKIIKYSEAYSVRCLDYAVYVIRRGGIVVFPTSTIYGLAGNAMRPDVLRRIFHIKNRSYNKPISILISGMEALKNVADTIPKHFLPLMKKVWPGKVTFVVKANKKLPELLTSGTGKIGVRVPYNATAMGLVKYFGSPITATSANVSGNPGVSCIDEIEEVIFNSVDLIIDGGLLRGGLGSSVVDITTNSLNVLREGTLPKNNFIN